MTRAQIRLDGRSKRSRLGALAIPALVDFEVAVLQRDVGRRPARLTNGPESHQIP